MNWNNELQKRLMHFESNSQVRRDTDALSISIKVRVDSGCFHREHSPHAFAIIDKSLNENKSGEFHYIEHENGPEIITYIGLASTLIVFTTAVIEIVSTIIKARSEGIQKGDRPDDYIELITRGFTKTGKLKEEKILRIRTGDKVPKKVLKKKLQKALEEYFD